MAVDMHPGSAPSPSLFALIFDELTAYIQELSWCMLFADGILLMDESRDGVNAKLERWPEAFESKVFKISCTKVEYMDCKFSGHIEIAETTMRIESHEVL